MQDLEKSSQVKWLLLTIKLAVESYENDLNRIHFDYDGAINLLEQAQMLVTESARCPRPADLPDYLPWCEKLYSGDEIFEPYIHDGSMSDEDYVKMHELMSEDEECEGWEL